jgi:esterase/lipase superfamily enzyme
MSPQGPPDDPVQWVQLQSVDDFKQKLSAVAQQFPSVTSDGNHEGQKHISLFVHGFKNTWLDEARRYKSICDALFSEPNSLGECVLYDWPSDGEFYDYLPDRQHARECANDLATILAELYDWMLDRQQEAQAQVTKARQQGIELTVQTACKAKTSIIAHSMGNYLLQNALASVWTRKNQPLLVSLVNQLLMVAADVDNDIFSSGEDVDRSDGDAIANLTYRVTALYSGLDPVLGLSAGLKHFGKRRLGRSGLDRDCPVPDNVWDVDCSAFFKKNNDKDIHAAYFNDSDCLKLMGELLRGTDRTVLVSNGDAPTPLAKAQQV